MQPASLQRVKAAPSISHMMDTLEQILSHSESGPRSKRLKASSELLLLLNQSVQANDAQSTALK